MPARSALRSAQVCVRLSVHAPVPRKVPARIVNLPVKRLKLLPKFGNSWREFTLNHENSFDDLEKMLSAAKPIGADYGKEPNRLSEGRFGYQPVDIAGSYHNGHLYYPVQTTRNQKEEYTDEHGKKIVLDTSRKELVLIRSDRSIQHIVKVPAPRGTPPDERLLKLSDGTLIEAVPKSSLYATWAWESIYAFHKNRSKTRRLPEILTDVKEYLTKNVWLPFAHDYDLLTLLVPVTFSQAIFKAVPLILVTGAPGSGKSALGRAMVNLCANAAMVGQISAAAVARLIDETKGFVVFDDLESIGRRKGRDAQFSDLVQALKLSYNRETSWKTWTDVSRAMSVKRINFFGVKMINNTTGADHILGSRVLKVFMRKLPVQARPLLDPSAEFDPVKLTALRNELHTWTFENVRLIDQTYQRIFPRVTDRLDEITAPLKVFAELSASDDLQNGLQRALAFQVAVTGENTDPVELLKEAVKKIILEGYREVAPTHILLEMKRLSFQKPAQLMNESQKWDDPAWVGRQLRRLELVEVNSLPKRQFLHGKYLRIYPLRQESIDNVLDSLSDNSPASYAEPLDFCTECVSCPYRTLECPIMTDRLSVENTLRQNRLTGNHQEYFN